MKGEVNNEDEQSSQFQDDCGETTLGD